MVNIRSVVAIPVRNEAERIGDCLRALDAQIGARLHTIVLLVNNTTDGTAQIARGTRLHPDTTLVLLEQDLPPAQATAGGARRIAMEAAARLAGPGGILLTTDADGTVDPDWLAANLAAMEAGADAVAGWVELHPEEWGRIPAKLHEDDARECAYDALCDEIHARLDPDPADPVPRHTQHSGASIAVTVEAYMRCGGVPPLPSGEDRALIAALRRVDAAVRHAPEVHVFVSGRTEGRSQGGMADTIRRRMTQPDEYIDDRLEPAAACAFRARARADTRVLFDNPCASRSPLVAALQMDEARLDAALAAPTFGAAWEMVERASPALIRVRVAVADLPAQTEEAEAILAGLRRPLDDRAGTQVLEAES